MQNTEDKDFLYHKFVEHEHGLVQILVNREFKYKGENGKAKKAIIIIGAFPNKILEKLGKNFNALSDQEKNKKLGEIKLSVSKFREYTTAIYISPLDKSVYNYKYEIATAEIEGDFKEAFKDCKTISSIVDQIIGEEEPKNDKADKFIKKVKERVNAIVGKQIDKTATI